MTPAQALTKSVRDVFALYGFLTFKVGSTAGRNSQGDFYRTGTPGSCDLVAIKGPHRYALVEIKAGKDRLSENQKQFQASVEAVGGVYLVVRNVEDVLRWVQGE